MAKGRKAPELKLNERQRRILEKYFSKRTIPIQSKQRINILFQANQGKGNGCIAESIQVSRHTVSKWRNRWFESYSELCEYGQGNASDRNLLDRMLLILSDNPRSGAPERISLAEKQNLVALACQNPKDFGVPITQWSHEMLAKVAMAKGLVERISPRYVGEVLKKK
jgi:hypothetical protein